MTSVAVSREAAVAELMSSFAPDVVVNDEARLDKYRFDRARDPSAGYPIAAVRAESTPDVQTTLAWATRHRIPVVLRGAGTGLCGLEAGVFWAGLERVIEECAPRNEVLLAVRDRIQSDLDEWHAAHPGPLRDAAEYVACLARIGYLVDEPGDFTVATQDVDGGAEANPQPGALTARRKCDE